MEIFNDTHIFSPWQKSKSGQKMKKKMPKLYFF